MDYLSLDNLTPASTLRPLVTASNYFGADRRRRKRLSLDDLTQDDAEEQLAEYVRSMPAEDLEEDPQAWWQKALEILDLPRNAVANLVASVAGIQGTSKEKFAGMQKIYGSDLLKGAGLQTGFAIPDFLLGLTADVLGDPLTYVGGLGVVGKGVGFGGKVLKGAAAEGLKAAEMAANAARAGRLAEKGVTVAKALPEVRGSPGEGRRGNRAVRR
jgi:hypothetical protein